MPALPVLFSFLLLQAAPEYTIEGTVVDAVTEKPLARARVAIFSSRTGPSVREPVVTGAGGRFRFTGLPPGKYSLIGERLGYARQPYGAHRLYSGYLTGVVLGEHDRADDLVFRLIPGGAITGTVTDQQGDPVAGITVQALQIARLGKTRHVISRFLQSTDDRGQYRIPNLPAGTFIVAASGQPTQEPASVEPAAYPVTWFPNATGVDAAAAVKVQPGQESRADITVQAVPAARLVIMAPAGDAGTGRYVTLTADALPGVGMLVAPSHWLNGRSYTYDRVPPGHYTLNLVSANRLAASQDIDVAAPVTQVEVGSAAPARVTLHVAFTGKPPSSGAPVSVRLQSMSSATTFGQVMQSDGSAVIPAAYSGSYLPIISQGGVTMAVSSVKARDASQAGLIVTIPPTGDVEFEVAVDSSAVDLKGRVMCNGSPKSGVLVMLVQRSTWEALGGYRYDQSDSDGTFTWNQVPAGEYFMFAFEEGDPQDYDDPATIRELMPAAQPLTVTGNASQQVTVELRPSPAR